MKAESGKTRAVMLALICVLTLGAVATAQAGVSFGYYGGRDGNYSISLGFSGGGYYSPRYYAPRNYAPVRTDLYYDAAPAGPCRIDEITSYYRDGSISCAPNPRYYDAYDGYYRSPYRSVGYYDAYPAFGFTYYGGGYRNDYRWRGGGYHGHHGGHYYRGRARYR